MPPRPVRSLLALLLALILSAVPSAAELQQERIWDLASDGSGYPAGIPLPPRTVVFTIDDGPLERSEAISSWLRAEGVPAAFYFVSSQVDTHADGPAILGRIRDDGHMIANHTVSHANLTVDPAAAPAEIGDAALVFWPYMTNGVHSFRPPFAAWNASVHAAVAPIAALDRVTGPLIHEVATADWTCISSGLAPEECAAVYLDQLVNQRPDQNAVLMAHEHVDVANPDYHLEKIQAIVAGIRAEPGAPFEFAPVDAVPGLAGTLELGPPTTWSTAFSDAAGWDADARSSTLRAGDVDGDGFDDVCGRDASGVVCALSDGGALGAPALWTTSFGDASGHDALQYATTLQLGDVDGDGAADLCVRSASGVECETSNGVDAFVASSWASPDFSDAAGFDAAESRYRSIRLGDIDGDGRADLCGRDALGARCALSGPMGFAPSALWSLEVSDAAGFSPAEYGATLGLGDVDGDTRADLCIREADGMACAISDGAGFGPLAAWQPIGFSDANGWTDRSRFLSMRLGDVDGDGLADLCTRSSTGIECASSDGTRFIDRRHVTNTTFLDLQGWDAEEHGPTLLMGRLRGGERMLLCGRDDGGLLCQDAPLDPDRDGVPTVSDNCFLHWNPDQADGNDNGVGDACTPTGFACGLGVELAVVLPLLAAASRRRASRRGGDARARE